MESRARRWTPEEVARLRRLAPRLPLAELARELGRTRDAVRTKAAHERLPLKGASANRGLARTRRPWETMS